MRIRELGILKFGKFNNEKIKLTEGLNIFIGKNESGKSTVFAFILGMFYGFAKDSTKKRIFEENLEKYRPWTEPEYRGYLEVESEKLYRIERDFNKNELEFLNLTDGEDLSNSNDLIKYTKIKQPGVYLFGLNSTVFSNTLFIGQLQTKLEQKSYEVLREKIENFSTSKEETVNIDMAIGILQKQLDELGRENLSKTVIGKLNSEIKDLNKKILSFEEKEIEYNSLLNKQQNLKIRQAEINKDLYRAKLIEEQSSYNEVLSKKREIENLKSRLLDKSSIGYNSYERVIEIEKEIENLKSKANDLLTEVNANSIVKFDNEKEIKDDYFEMESINNLFKELDSINYSKEIEFLLLDIKNVKYTNQNIISFITIGLILALLILVVSIYFKLYFINVISIGIGIYIYLRTVKLRVNLDVINRLKEKIEDYKNRSDDKTKRKKDLDLQLNKLLKKYGIEDRLSLENYLKEKINHLDKSVIESEFFIGEKKKNEGKIKLIEESINSLREEQINIFKECGVKNIVEFKEKFNRDIKDLSLDSEIESLEKVVEVLLRGRKFETLNHNIEVEDIDTFSKERENKEIELELIRIKERILIIENSIKTVEKYKEELKYAEKILLEKEEEKGNVERAIEIIKSVSVENKKDILPIIKENMSKLFSKITNNKYEEVYIDSNFKISVYDKEVDKYIEVEALSNGTIDQIYLTFRLAVLNLLFKNAPIILDDHFLQYDDERLKNTLMYLLEESKNRQIILFSATEREKNILDETRFKYNLINM